VRIGRHPFLGYGPGFVAALKPGPHNQFLKVWMDLGLPGLLFFCAVLAAAAAVFLSRGSLVGLVAVGFLSLKAMFSHNMLDDRTALLLLGLLLSVTLTTKGDETEEASIRLRKSNP
ncbi:MAG: O-antigen ligase family protein, partial [Acidobacteria bacterium]|nr:O-antigen ligase family protein [Acidobacteriota bacterium]